MTTSFGLTYDYLCPFARIANETVIEAVADGVSWDVTFLPFSLAQTKVGDQEPAAWERPRGADHTRGIVAHQWGLAVRDDFPEHFAAFHLALYNARFDEGRDVDDEAVLRRVAEDCGLASGDVAEVVAGGKPLASLAALHTEAVEQWAVFGVPTFIAGDEAVFVRLMERHRRDDVERVVDLLTWDRLNEFKRTRIPR
jgi:hypothetical protein